ncbi:MAG: SDR family oxidoreductase [Gammaproteobacteria bacterium]|nr:SDR family oxidoreductase [Gammaproteobacteria bacterium]
MKTACRTASAGFELLPGEHPIVPLMLRDAKLAQDYANGLRQKGVLVTAFSFPVVPVGEDRIRIQLSAAHDIEILMHFAGIGIERFALETTRDEWDRIISVNLTGTFLVMQAAGAVMVEAGYGRIVSMASAAGERGGTGRTAYGASKGGVAAMTRVMALEWAAHGITVNTLAPGAIDTALVQKMHETETRRAYLQRIPMNRYGAPEEVAAAAVCLALPESSYITGVTLAVDGGFLSGGVIKED